MKRVDEAEVTSWAPDVGRLRWVADTLCRAGERRAPTAELTAALEVLRADHLDPARVVVTPGAEEFEARLSDLAHRIGLTRLEVDCLVLVLAVELDANVGSAHAALVGDPRAVRPRVGTVLELAGRHSLDPEARAALGAGGRLAECGLLETAAESSAPALLRTLRAPDRVVAHLLGDDAVSAPLRGLGADVVPLQLPEAEMVARAIRGGTPLVWVRDRPETAGAATAAAALALAGLGCLVLDLDAVDDGRLDESMLRELVREAVLTSSGLLVLGGDRLGDRPTVLRRLQLAPPAVVVIGTRPWNGRWTDLPPVSVEATLTPRNVRATMWESLFPHLADPDGADSADGDWSELLGLRVAPEAVIRIARSAAEEATARDEQLDLPALRAASRRVGSGDGWSTTSGRVVAGYDDLILPDATMADLREIVSWSRHRDEVLGPGRLGSANGRGRGVTALFTGGPGTGKTLAATVLAGELGLDLRTVNLAAVVDKYIGETEKNLERVFGDAEAHNVVLFFDEADALFGSRSEVKDSRDRYANQEVAYLLQRMETFDGIAVLASNLRGNFDAAFTRRLQFIIHFPDPDERTRASLLRRHLAAAPRLDATDPVDVELVAQQAELSGGEIRNVVVAAAFAAASDATGVGMRHVVNAVRREYRKLGRRLPDLPYAP